MNCRGGVAEAEDEEPWPWPIVLLKTETKSNQPWKEFAITFNPPPFALRGWLVGGAYSLTLHDITERQRERTALVHSSSAKSRIFLSSVQVSDVLLWSFAPNASYCYVTHDHLSGKVEEEEPHTLRLKSEMKKMLLLWLMNKIPCTACITMSLAL